MPRTVDSLRQSAGLVALTVGLMLLIVVGPFIVVRQANREAVDANGAVNHTHEVSSTVQALMYDLRNREAATVAYAFGHDSPAIQDRLTESKREIPNNLERLRRLTRDNPEQQLRIGRLAAIIEQRGTLSDEILARPTGKPDQRDIDWLLERNPLRFIGNEIADSEQILLAARSERADRLEQRASTLTWLAMVAQVSLLAAAALVLRWQFGTRRAAQAAAARAAARASAILQTVREPVVLLDPDLRVVMHNPAFAEVFSIDGDALGRPLEAIGDGSWAGPDIRQRLGDVLARDRELWDHEVLYRDDEGRERNLLVNARRMVLPDSNDEVALVTANDVSAQKAIEQRVRELNRQLQGKVDQVSEVNRELEAFSYSVSHDLRAPLRHISGFVGKLSRHLGDGLDDAGRHYLDVIGSSARHMSALIDDLLVYSRLGRSALRLQAVDVQSLVEETRAMLDADVAADQPGHAVQWRIGPMPILVADENMLRQVWHNLMDNAVKYSGRSEPALVEITHQRNADGDHHFSVRDNGAGFDMQYAGKLFGVFQRLHAASEFDGTGVGLASVKRVVTRHNGHVWAESAPGEGATFHFTLPANLDLKPASPP